MLDSSALKKQLVEIAFFPKSESPLKAGSMFLGFGCSMQLLQEQVRKNDSSFECDCFKGRGRGKRSIYANDGIP